MRRPYILRVRRLIKAGQRLNVKDKDQGCNQLVNQLKIRVSESACKDFLSSLLNFLYL